MYLSKVKLDWKLFYNPYEWHRAIWKLFPEMKDCSRDFLFRVEETFDERYAQILLQSQTEPKITDEQSIIVSDSKYFDMNKSLANELFYFRVTANVTKKIKDANNHERSIRVPLINEEEQIAWLTRKFENSGIIMNVQIKKNPPLYFKKRGNSGKLITVTFDGIVKVVCRESFTHLITKGIGSAKSFGCGLLSVCQVS